VASTKSADEFFKETRLWQGELAKLRKIPTQLPLEETIKWFAPAHTCDGAISFAILCFWVLVTATGCDGRIYVRDAVTDGDTFYLAPSAYAGDDDPVLQSWVSYSLTRSACQLEIGGDNPARVSTYDCELIARQHLLETWQESRDNGMGHTDDYLDTLLSVRDADFLEAYTVHYLGREGWREPTAINIEAFRDWRRVHLRGHIPTTRIIGSWGFRRASPP